jgi:hypothetical protein
MEMPELTAELERQAQANNLKEAIALIGKLKQQLDRLKNALPDSESRSLPPKMREEIAASETKFQPLTQTATITQNSPVKQVNADSDAIADFDPNRSSAQTPIDFDRLHKLSGSNQEFEKNY